MPIEFDKYKRYGAYHWHWYGKKGRYTQGVDFLKDWVKEKNTLDVGAGDGFITHFLGLDKGIDINPSAIRIAKSKGVKIDLGDATNMPYDDEQFDSALASDVAEHFEDVDGAIKEIRRVIKKYFYVNIPVNEKFIEPDHHNAWTSDEFIDYISKFGFELVEDPVYLSRKFHFKFKKV